MENWQTKGFYDFGEFRLDVQNRLLRRGDEIIPLNLKEFEVLFFFVENAGRVVEKNALLDAVWKDTFIEEGTLTQNISRLRKKLEAANGSGEKFIETLPKRGYRFLPEVVKADADALIIEEEIVQRIRIEERLTLSDAETRRHGDAESGIITLPAENKIAALSQIPASPRRRVFISLLLAFGILGLSAIGFAVYRTSFYHPEPKTIRVAKVAPFSGLPGREDMPAFSPDGKLVAFVWNKGNDEDFDVYVRMTGAGEPVRLTRNEADDIRPTFSPDGKTIAFVRRLPTRGEVFLIPALGGAERKICDLRRSSSSVSFSPDGRFLAVHDGDESGERSGIFLVNLETGEKRRLTAPPELAADDRPAFAPDGKSIAFIRSFAPVVQEIFLLPLTDGGAGEPRQITFDKSWIGGAAWSADGGRIVFSSQRKYNSQINIWQIAADGAGQPEVLATGGKGIGNLAVSPDKRLIAFVEESFGTNIRRIQLKGAGSSVKASKFAASNRSDNSPNVSPDGSRVVFASNRTGKYEIWIAGADGANARQLTEMQNSSAGSPRFSPDGRQIVFDAQIDGNGDIFVVSADGGASRRLTDSPSFDFMPAWSADGNSIYFASDRSGTAQIYKMPATGGEAVQITRQGGRESYASPDGTQLYYSKGGSGGLWRVSADGGDEQSVPELATAGYWRYWTLTPTGIYFVARSEQPPYKIMFYDFSINQTAEITATDTAPIWVYPGLGASADGKTILYTQSDQNASSINLAELAN